MLVAVKCNYSFTFVTRGTVITSFIRQRQVTVNYTEHMLICGQSTDTCVRPVQQNTTDSATSTMTTAHATSHHTHTRTHTHTTHAHTHTHMHMRTHTHCFSGHISK